MSLFSVLISAGLRAIPDEHFYGISQVLYPNSWNASKLLVNTTSHCRGPSSLLRCYINPAVKMASLVSLKICHEQLEECRLLGCNYAQFGAVRKLGQRVQHYRASHAGCQCTSQSSLLKPAKSNTNTYFRRTPSRIRPKLVPISYPPFECLFVCIRISSWFLLKNNLLEPVTIPCYSHKIIHLVNKY
jgi:hypothetical protein